ncbi:MAG TPA: phosphoribosylformylglycinamidine synthase subunit PurL, partial [Chthoniobacterales bacterium]|nr:phosphoribosylformylglycinamidine synthase subunit PurL [Chthoniobacterales bacterium]
AFKMESHNHPSAVEPFQGAATGVGGIIRDIFTMGARPVFLMNSLRFGPIHGDSDAARKNRKLVRGVVAGIAHYGNCVGVPTIGGEIAFDESYNGNPLVNVLCLGILKKAEIARGAASGVGNAVFYVGSETGRDGLAGAAFASRDLTEESKADRPAVQVGDPFRGKLLLEACLELLTSGAVAGIQDMGAAGLTCSTCETASRGGTGVQIDLALVPKRETGMTPYEILLSESQERMLIIVRSGEEERVKEVFEKWDLPYSQVGIVTDDGFMRVLNDSAVEVEIPAKQLADDAPVYEREVAIPAPPQAIAVSDLEFHDPKDSLLKLLAHPTVASKNWIFRQYDYTVRAGTVVPPGSDAAVFYVREADKFLAATTDCNHLYCRLDPREGAKIAVAEAARNLTCSGATPLAVTDNLNFGNPYRPENFWQLREAVEGLSEACRRFETPVTGGNVSLYNESPEGTIDPTPTVGMIGLIEDERWITRQYFRNEGDVIFLIGTIGDEIGGSLYLKTIYGKKAGLPPRLNFDRELAVQKFLRALIRKGVVKSAHDCSEGGLAVALAECCMSGAEKMGARIRLPQTSGSSSQVNERLDVNLFNESQSRIVVSVPREASDLVEQEAAQAGIELTKLGSVGGSELAIEEREGILSWPLDQLHEAWYSSIALALSQQDL